MFLAFGQIPDASRPAASWPRFSLVGTVPVVYAPSIPKGRKRRISSPVHDISDEKSIRDSISKDVGESAGMSAIVIDRNNSGQLGEDEDLILILDSFLIAQED